MLDPSVLQAPLLDHRGLDLGAVRNVNYVLQQSFRYEYDAPVESCRPPGMATSTGARTCSRSTALRCDGG
jgi:hypothetical protein